MSSIVSAQSVAGEGVSVISVKVAAVSGTDEASVDSRVAMVMVTYSSVMSQDDRMEV